VEAVKRRDRDATRRKLLLAARAGFAEAGYDGTTTRDVAAAVGVNPALICRYFGSKEQLFAEAVVPEADTYLATVLAGPRERWGEAFIRYALEQADPRGGHYWLMALLRSRGHTEAAERLRTVIATALIRPLAERLGGPDAQLRAELIVSQLFGLNLLRFLLATPRLSRAEANRVVALMAPTLQAYVDADAGLRKPVPAPAASSAT
jgi:AcrR family transcriptional regulator